MGYLTVFKRFEIWLLVAVVAGLIWYAFRPEPVMEPEKEKETIVSISGEKQQSAKEDPQAEEKKTLEVDKVEISDSPGGKIVAVTLYGKSTSGKEVELNEENLLATTAAGNPVNTFFEPFRHDAFFEAEERSLVTVKLWLEEPTDAIWLDFQGERVKAELP